tara:strand:+ start:604 stop:747 length:144 start_codon:yes stop_codon:yes gene_type:complete
MNPKRKNNEQNDKYSIKMTFLKKIKYKFTIINKTSIPAPPDVEIGKS